MAEGELRAAMGLPGKTDTPGAANDPGGPGTLMRGDLVATRHGLLRVEREIRDASVPTGAVVGYQGTAVFVDVDGFAPLVEFLSADVTELYRPTWRRR